MPRCARALPLLLSLATGTFTPALYGKTRWRGFVTSRWLAAVYLADSSQSGAAGFVDGEPHGYDAQRPQPEAQPRNGTPCTDLNATTLAHAIATELCAASLKEAEELRARVHELEHALKRSQANLQADGPAAWAQQLSHASAPSRILDDRGSPQRPRSTRPRQTVKGRRTVWFVLCSRSSS